MPPLRWSMVELPHDLSSSASSARSPSGWSKPRVRARAIASLAACALHAVSAWLISFAAAPAPGPPMWAAWPPMAPNTGAAAAKASAEPPAMMVSAPLAAPSGPPLTGASR